MAESLCSIFRNFFHINEWLPNLYEWKNKFNIITSTTVKDVAKNMG